ncbi:hypothetical protein EVAR_23217_1 [Eumeta japonica]|uniref:Uncharacterized protein n=1 Tax=Eumeta variegata TaxID=151549 RepID=A0A4C1VGR5_EUMVA|nr:hypothetical protein EVAR_23217_1 [Eumeta japonica]
MSSAPRRLAENGILQDMNRAEIASKNRRRRMRLKQCETNEKARNSSSPRSLEVKIFSEERYSVTRSRDRIMLGFYPLKILPWGDDILLKAMQIFYGFVRCGQGAAGSCRYTNIACR